MWIESPIFLLGIAVAVVALVIVSVRIGLARLRREASDLDQLADYDRCDESAAANLQRSAWLANRLSRAGL